jgi:hypothetical protein
MCTLEDGQMGGNISCVCTFATKRRRRRERSALRRKKGMPKARTAFNVFLRDLEDCSSWDYSYATESCE